MTLVLGRERSDINLTPAGAAQFADALVRAAAVAENANGGCCDG